MTLGEEIPIIGDLFKIHFIENKGAAFGMTITNLVSPLGLEVSDETGKLILSIFSLIALVFIGVFLYRLASHKSPLPYFVALIFGGAMGNIIDRTLYGMIFKSINNYEGGFLHGRVVDMFYFDIWKGYLPDWIPFMGGEYYSFWPIFNIADSAISVGIIVILIFQGRFFRMHENAIEAEEVKSDSPSTEPSPSTNPASAESAPSPAAEASPAVQPKEDSSLDAPSTDSDTPAPKDPL